MCKATLSKYLFRKPVIFFLLSFSCVQSFAQPQPTGLGIVSPQLKSGIPLYLYSGQLIDDLLHHNTIKDSVTFADSMYSIAIGTAPPWFDPEYLKLDYEIFQLRAVTLSRNWIEVIVNKKTGQTAWVDRHAVTFQHWPDFLLGVFGVEVINAANNPIRTKPLDNASSVLNSGRSSLRPIAVQGEWMKVSTSQEKPGSIPKLGWIRWKKGNQMLITWSLLS